MDEAKSELKTVKFLGERQVWDLKTSVYTQEICDSMLPELYGAEDILIPRNGVVVDLGANIGLFSLAIHKRFHDVNVFAIEPCLENFKNICRNISENHLTHVYPVKCAINGDGRRQRFFQNSVNTGSSFAITDLAGDIHEDVEGKTFLQFMDDFGIKKVDFLKIDIEGAEFEILTTIPHDRIGFLGIEFHKLLDQPLEQSEQRIKSAKRYVKEIYGKRCFIDPRH